MFLTAIFSAILHCVTHIITLELYGYLRPRTECYRFWKIIRSVIELTVSSVVYFSKKTDYRHYMRQGSESHRHKCGYAWKFVGWCGANKNCCHDSAVRYDPRWELSAPVRWCGPLISNWTIPLPIGMCHCECTSVEYVSTPTLTLREVKSNTDVIFLVNSFECWKLAFFTLVVYKN